MGTLKIRSKKYGEHVVLFDDEDFNLIASFKWRPYTGTNNRNLYVRGYRLVNGKPEQIFMHRLVLGVLDPKIHIDHKDGNGLDNRKENLRQATASQNIANSGIRKNNTSGYKGVFKIHKSLYKATISCQNKRIHIGCYQNPEQAAEAYDKAAFLYFGQFARLNKPLQCNPNTNPHFRVINSFDAVDSGNYGYCKGCQSTIY